MGARWEIWLWMALRTGGFGDTAGCWGGIWGQEGDGDPADGIQSDFGAV